MSNITIEEMVAFKKQATEWVDNFWSKVTLPDEMSILDITLFDRISTSNDVVPYSTEKAYNQEYFIYSRFAIFGLGITEKAVDLLSLFAFNPGQISMYVAAIAHTYFAIDIDNRKLITYRWLKTMLIDGRPNNTSSYKEILDKLWVEQRTSKGNLVDIIDAFMLANDEEMKYLENEPS